MHGKEILDMGDFVIIKRHLKIGIASFLVISAIGCNDFEKLLQEQNHVDTAVRPQKPHSGRVLQSYTFPPDTTVIKANALEDQQLTAIDLPPQLISIDKNAFLNNKLSRINIPESVADVREGAFVGNPLQTVFFSEKLYEKLSNPQSDADITHRERIQNLAKVFGNGNGNTQYIIKDRKDNNIIYPQAQIITAHGKRTLVINNGVKSIGQLAYMNYTQIVKTLHARKNGDWPTAPNDKSNDKSYCEIVRNSDYLRCSGKGYAPNIEEITLPDGLTHISASAFGSNKLTKLTIPNSVKSIESFAFSGNPLTEVTMSKKLYQKLYSEKAQAPAGNPNGESIAWWHKSS